MLPTSKNVHIVYDGGVCSNMIHGVLWVFASSSDVIVGKGIRLQSDLLLP